MPVEAGSPNPVGPLRKVGRYALFDAIGHGGTATVHLGRLMGPAGFSKTVAVKRMHENVSRDPEIAAMFIDEARISARIRHPNVVAATDLLALDGETFLIMEYVHGESLAALNDGLRSRGRRMPIEVAVHVMRDVLNGLHAAHEALDEVGESLSLVHRDVSPHNIIVGIDGTARVLDFGIAKALGRLQDTHTGQVKGKLSYMAPEQLMGTPLDRRVDVFAAGVVLWETLMGRRLFVADNPGHVVQRVLTETVPSLDTFLPELSHSLVRAVARATERDREKRFASAAEFARELENAAEMVSARAVGEWVRAAGGERLEVRAQRLREIESTPITKTGPLPVVTEEQAERRISAGPDEATRSELRHVVLTPEDEDHGESTSRESLPAARPTRRMMWLAIAASLTVAAVFALRDAQLEQLQLTSRALPASATPLPAALPEAVVAGSTPAAAELPRAVEPEEPTVEPQQAKRPHRARAVRVAKKPAPAPKPVVRRAEDLFSRN
jgi:tRNA A-37 threonylcarbamoyl transferase component Bud32